MLPKWPTGLPKSREIRSRMRHQKKYEILIEFKSENVRFWRCQTHRNALYISISVVSAGHDKIRNFIVDAERHRRTPRLSAISGKAIDVCVAVFYGLWPIQCATLAEIGDAAITVLTKIGIEKVKQFYCKTGDKIRQISCQNLQNITNMAPQIYIKSMKNQGCVADAFLERFGAALGCQMLDFGSQNLQNSIKMAPKNYPKSRLRRGCVFGAFSGGPRCDFGSRVLISTWPFWRQFSKKN